MVQGHSTFGRALAAFAAAVIAQCTAVAADIEIIASREKGWLQFRGPRRDGISTERNLLPQWPEAGPRALWSVTNIGRGFSAPIIAGGRLFITGDLGEDLVISALDLSGRPLWRSTNGGRWVDPYPGARASVTWSEGRLYHQNAHGRLACLEAATGRELWAMNVLKQFGGSNLTWGLSECLAVDERAVYVTAGGPDALVVALNKFSGAVLWKTEPPREWAKVDSASYASPILVRFAGRRLLIGASLRHAYCVDAENGLLQWTQPMPTTYSVVALTPAVIGDAVFMTAPHGKGGKLWRLRPGAQIGAEELWTTRLDTCHGGVVVHDGKLFGAFYPGRKGWAAVDTKDGGVVYQAAEFAKGSVLYADHRLYALCEDGLMLLLEPQADAFAVRGKFQFAQARARDAWAHPVVLDGRLYLRYHDALTCYDVAR